MSDNRYISGIPNGLTIGGTIAFVLGFIPLVNFFGAAIGGAAASYVEEYGIIKSSLSGIAVGLFSLLPIGLWTTTGILMGGSGLLESQLLAGIGALGGVLGSVYGFVSFFLAPLFGMIGGLSLGVYFHLIHKATD
ncbi:hypothetical protein ACOZ4I_15660 [Haloarcula salina]|uniref:hypothetical protein n=1 Tax=Haloarcula salina TaxID=1429914 RepID=UPI003C6EC74A